MRRRDFVGALLAAGVQRDGNRYVIPEGGVEIEWLSDSTFCYRRRWEGTPPRAKRASEASIDVKSSELIDRVVFHGKYLTLDVLKNGTGLTVKKQGSAMASLDVRRDNGRPVVEHRVKPDERFYGLGARRAASLDARGLVVDTTRPLLISSAGYGEYYPAPGTYRFDLSAGTRRSAVLPGRDVEYLFHYGPNPKDILEEHPSDQTVEVGSRHLLFRSQRGSVGTWETLRDAVRELAHASLSGLLLHAFDLSRYEPAGGALFARAAQLASILPAVKGPPGAARSWRNAWVPYLLTYVDEARDRGFPVVRAVPMQYPEDTASVAWPEEFLLGDELLIAPVLNPGGTVNLYLPRGVWTRLATNEVYSGRQQIAITAADDELPVFARNGSIVPQAGTPLELHYYPRLAAEFFLYEEERREYSQFHASPALDLLRLESESTIERDCEWVVHHIDRPRRVWLGETQFRETSQPRAGTWSYDGTRRNLSVRLHARARGDEIVHIAFQ
jgi:alpha-glucosidase (family GH31 glycosyl hydrolase)